MDGGTAMNLRHISASSSSADAAARAENRDAPLENGLAPPRRTFAIAAVLGAMAMVVGDAGMTNVALPTIARTFEIRSSNAVLVVTAYQTAVVMALLPSASLGERYGYRRIFRWGVALFLCASAASAMASSLLWLIGARFIQGLGGAAVLALGVALLRFSVSDGRLGAAISWNALTVALSSAAAPAIGALILSQSHWPWLYAVNLPLGVAVMCAASALPQTPRKAILIDFVSIALNCLVCGLFIIAIQIALSAPLKSAVLMLAALLALLKLVRREAPKATPLIPLDLLRSGSFSASVVASICCFSGLSAGLIALPFYMQRGLNLSATVSALYMIAWPLGVAAAATIAGRLASHTYTAKICVAGGAVLALSLAAAALWPLHGDPRTLAMFTIAAGAGFGFFQTANNRNMFLSAPRDRSAAAGGMQGTARVSGQTMGALLAGAVFAATPIATAPQTTLAWGALCVLAAAAVSAFRMTTVAKESNAPLTSLAG